MLALAYTPVRSPLNVWSGGGDFEKRRFFRQTLVRFSRYSINLWAQACRDQCVPPITEMPPAGTIESVVLPYELTGIQWLICVIAALGFAFDTYELLVLPLIVRRPKHELRKPVEAPGERAAA